VQDLDVNTNQIICNASENMATCKENELQLGEKFWKQEKQKGESGCLIENLFFNFLFLYI